MTQLLRFVTRTQLVRFRHGLKPSVTSSIPRSQTVTLPQFSTKTSATRLRDRSPANDAQPTAFTTPTVCGEEFIHIRDLNPESLSDSVVRIDQPLEADTIVALAAAAAAVAVAVATAAIARPAPETSVGLDRHPVALPEELSSNGIHLRCESTAELSSNVIHLSCESTAEGGVCHVYLVGTLHFSEESYNQVRAIVDFLKPEAVFLELCRTRVPVLPHEAKQKSVKDEFRICDCLRRSELFVAYEEAIKYGGRVILGDRPVEITLKRAWSKMTLWSKTKAVFSESFPAVLLSSSDDLNEMKMHHGATIDFFFEEMPNLREAFVHERDQYMSSKLLEVASESRSVVAVVGVEHLQGIKRNWKQPVVVEDLMTVPSAGLSQAGLYIIWRLYRKCKE